MIEEFKKFALRGNIADIAIGFTVGTAFSAIAKSLVDDTVMPPISWLLGAVDFSSFFIVLQEGALIPGPYNTLIDARAAGAVTINYGILINTIISFILISFAMFLLIRTMNRLHQKKEEEEHLIPQPPNKQEELLTEIRDVLKSR